MTLAIAKILVDDLDGDAALPGHSDFLLEPMPDKGCVQLISVVKQPGRATDTGIAYRIWRMSDGMQWALIRSQPRAAR